MAITLYSGFVPVCLQLLGGLKVVLQKTEAHTTEQKWDPAVVLNLRLFPDMFTLERQVRQFRLKNQRAEREVKALDTDQGLLRAARKFGWVLPGEQKLRIPNR